MSPATQLTGVSGSGTGIRVPRFVPVTVTTGALAVPWTVTDVTAGAGTAGMVAVPE
ncbi:MAG: hypothetical protein ACRDVW_07080 [Acidimicrobiales bacterium]